VDHSTRPIIVFSCLGHLYVHLCTAFYFVIVLALEDAWRLPYHELISLWTLGSLLVGAAAVPAGMLSDRLGAATMMVVFFVGMGLCAIGAGFSASPVTLMPALTGLGLFGAVYHPVGVPWIVRNITREVGKVLGFNGIFGSLGAAGAGVTAGVLTDLASWRIAFIVPGVISTVTGVALLVYVLRGSIPEGVPRTSRTRDPRRADMMRAFGILMITMFLAGLIYHTIQTSLPKVFAERHGGIAGEGVLGIGLLVAGVYTVAAVMQVIGGHLADRFPLKAVYLGTMLLQVPMLWLVAVLGGIPLILVATIMVMAGAGALPAENMLLSRFTPEKRHGLAFGVKFALSFGAAPLAVQLVAIVNARTGGFYWVFTLLTALALVAVGAAALLPGERKIEAGGAALVE
jgi:FSR family fosmidomycin resistance protein-like MFS transporter